MMPRPTKLQSCLMAGFLIVSLLWAYQPATPPASAEAPSRVVLQPAERAYPIAQAAAPIEMRYVPAEAILAVNVHPARVLSSAEFEPAPIEVLQAMGLEQFGIDPLDIAQVLAVVSIIEIEFEYNGEVRTDSVPAPGAIIRFSKPYSLEGSLAAHQPGWEQDEFNGGLLLRQDNYDETCYYMPDDTTLLVGDESSLETMLAQDSAPDSKLVEALTDLGDEHDIAAVMNIAPLRPMLESEAPDPDQLPPPLAELLKLPELLEIGQVTANLTGGRPSSLELIATDAAAAEEMQGILHGAFGFGHEMLLGMLEEEMGGSDDPIEQATLAYIQRVSEFMLEAVQPQLNGDRLTLSYQPAEGDQAALVSSLSSAVAMGLPAIGAARQAARRNMAMNNMRQLALGILNHESATARFPKAGGSDEEGHERPGLSWRVYMLPYVESQTLYNQFHFDEPWDSEHNMSLIEQMPEVYKTPGVETEPGYTHYQLVTGEDTAFNGGLGPKIREFQDGLSMTALIVEADTPVIWTKPDDWEYNPEDPFQDLGHVQPGGVFLASFADGHTAFISLSADPEVVKAIFTPQGGEQIDYNELNPDW